MNSLNNESHKKSSRVLEKIGQKISNIKEDIADNIERRRQMHSHANGNQMHFTSRTNTIDESLVIEKKPSTPPESHPQRTSSKNRERERKKFYIFAFDKRKREKEKYGIFILSHLRMHSKTV
jgi:hypothetical protein